ncbi:MAG: zinc ribbon domain-containing protein [Clostridia bacterium]|nr:zinc ribbon domain-containing protein [Clostridia bacterium]
MGTFEDVLYKAKVAAENAGKKTGELVDQVRLKMDLAAAEKELAAAYEGLGRLVYEAHQKGEETASLIEGSAARVEELTEKATAIRQQIDEYNNVARCSGCGAANTEDALYCKQCGQKLEK